MTFFTSTSLCSIWPPTTWETKWFALSSVINWEAKRLREEVVIERVLLGHGIAAYRVPVVRPIGQIGANLTLARAVIEVAVSDGLSAPHLVDSDVAIGNRTVSKRDVHTISNQVALLLRIR